MLEGRRHEPPGKTTWKLNTASQRFLLPATPPAWHALLIRHENCLNFSYDILVCHQLSETKSEEVSVLALSSVFASTRNGNLLSHHSVVVIMEAFLFHFSRRLSRQFSHFYPVYTRITASSLGVYASHNQWKGNNNDKKNFSILSLFPKAPISS